jgi:RNA polymerase sigma-70 factor (ECF subfamily)
MNTAQFKKMSDEALLAAYRKGDRAAASALIERHKRRICDYIYMMVRDRVLVDDLFQETLIKALRFLDEGRYTENGKFLSWVLRIAHNQVIDHFRRRRQQGLVSESDAGYDLLNNSIFSDPTVEQTMVSQQIDDDLRALVKLLPEEQQEVVMLRYFENMSFKDIAEDTGVSINTALGRMRYALINMRKLIREKQLILT